MVVIYKNTEGGSNLVLKELYDKTKGYKTMVGFVIAFIAGGLAYTKVIDAETAKQIEMVATYLIAFGLGDKVAQKMS